MGVQVTALTFRKHAQANGENKESQQLQEKILRALQGILHFHTHYHTDIPPAVTPRVLPENDMGQELPSLSNRQKEGLGEIKRWNKQSRKCSGSSEKRQLAHSAAPKHLQEWVPGAEPWGWPGDGVQFNFHSALSMLSVVCVSHRRCWSPNSQYLWSWFYLEKGPYRIWPS